MVASQHCASQDTSKASKTAENFLSLSSLESPIASSFAVHRGKEWEKMVGDSLRFTNGGTAVKSQLLRVHNLSA
jgi:hypothetical protein